MNTATQSEADLDLYRFDGRSYEIKQIDKTLTLHWRDGLMGRYSFSFLTFVIMLMLLSGSSSPLRYWLGAPSSERESLLYIVLQVALSGLCSFHWWKLCLREYDRTFEKSEGQFRYRRDRQSFIQLPRIRCVRASPHRNRFLISVELEGAKPITIGHIIYLRSEHAWRHDAAQIAAFLEVPLEIPPV
jgi:hypothetical protein